MKKFSSLLEVRDFFESLCYDTELFEDSLVISSHSGYFSFVACKFLTMLPAGYWFSLAVDFRSLIVTIKKK